MFFFFFFFCQGFPSQTLAIHRIAEKGGYHRLFHYTTSTCSQAFICNFVCEVTITFFKSQRLCLPDCYSMRFNTLLNYHLIDWLIDNAMFIFLIDELILGFFFTEILTLETCGLQLASTITLVLQANQLIDT